MREALILFLVEFNNLENRDGRYEVQLGIFADEWEGEEHPSLNPYPKVTAFHKVSEHLDKMKPIRPYIGWDNNIYPQFYVKKTTAQ